MWWLFTQQALAKAWFLLRFTVCVHQTRIAVSMRTSIIISLFKSIIDDHISKILSNGWTSHQWNCCLMFYVLFLFDDFNLAMKRSLAINIYICLNHQKLWSLLASLSVGSSRWNYEVQKHFLFYVHRHGTYDQMMCLIFLFLDQF